MKEFALFLSNINDYEEAIEEFQKLGYPIDYKWNEYILNEKAVTWNHDAYLLLDTSIQLHNHNGDLPVFTDIKYINLEQFSKP